MIKALGNPIRWHALDILNQREASPKELAQEIGVEVGLASYHVTQLKDRGFVELVRTEPRRGATEHFYVATKRSIFTDEQWAKVPENMRSTIVANELALTGRLLTAALDSGSFEARGDRHHSLCEWDVDEEGWGEAMGLLEETLDRLLEIRAVSDERRLKSDQPAIPIAVSIIGFEKAPQKIG